MLVRKIINVAAPLTEEEKAELAALKNRPIVYDEDCMPLSEESERKNDYIMRKYNTRRVTKELWLKEFPEDFQKRKAEATG
ncbi:MAG: hypothetical protein IKT98_08315 [Selenomonadaceae bacterium]|nr:hypothetical protein [Selenomonadaceae bacterium]